MPLQSTWDTIKKTFTSLNLTPSNEVIPHDPARTPYLIALIKNIYQTYKKNDRNSWDYQISRFDSDQSDKNKRRAELLTEYNKSLASFDAEDPWVIDESDENYIKLKRKSYHDNERILSKHIEALIKKELDEKSLTPKNIKKRKKHLFEIAALVQFQERSQDKGILYFSYSKYKNSTEVLSVFKELLEENEETIQQKIQQLINLKNKINKRALQAIYSLSSPPQIKDRINLTRWEKAEQFIEKNTLLQVFNTVWNAMGADTTLFKWLIFLGFIFSFTIPLAPIAIATFTIYVAIHFFSFIKSNNRKIYNLPHFLEKEEEKQNLVDFIQQKEEEKQKLADFLKQEAFKKGPHQPFFSCIQDIFQPSDVDAENPYKELHSLKTEEFCSPPPLEKNKLEASSIYQYLTKTHSKTQFTVSLITNLTNITLIAYCIPLVFSTILNFIGLAAAATLVASPITLGVLIAVCTSIFLIRHYIQYRAKKNTYQKKITALLTERCLSNPINNNDEKREIAPEKWKKFELLQKEIRQLEELIKQQAEKNDQLPCKAESQSILLPFTDYLRANDIYKKSNYQDKIESEKVSFFKKAKKIAKHSFYFLTGGFSGVSLARQIAPEVVSFKTILKLIALPLIMLIPLMLVNGIATLLTYYLNNEQHDRLFFAKHIDSKLRILESRRNVLSYLTATLKVLNDRSINPGDTIENSLNTPIAENELTLSSFPFYAAFIKNASDEHPLTTKPFTRPTRALTLPLFKQQNSDLSEVEANEVNSCPNLTR